MSKTTAQELKILRQKVVDISAKKASLETHNFSLESQLKAEIEKRGLAERKCCDIEAACQTQREFYTAEYDKLLTAFKEAQRARFGRKSERFVDDGNIQLSLFEINIEPDQKPTDPNDIETITYQRPKSKKSIQDTAGIPHREVIIPVSEADKICICGCIKEVIGYETSQRLNYQPAVFELITEKREKVACRKGCCGVVSAPLADRILPKCKATESLLAYIAVSKVLDRQPLYHLEKKITDRHHWHIPRQTMARWLIQLSESLQPLVNQMKEVILEYDIAAIDATGLQVLNEPNRPAQLKSYAYCIRGGPADKQVILYEYNAYSQKNYVEETLLDFKGILHCDASSVYNQIQKNPDIKLSYCHAHARRKFEQIVKASKNGKAALAAQAMKIYTRLYAVEKEATHAQLSPEERCALREKKSRPILAEFKQWLLINQANTLPKSPIGQAIEYVLSHWDGLQTYLMDGRAEIDNNATERAIKPFVIARKNFLFACTQAGADALGVHFSLILTATHHGLNPMQYYTEILKKIPSCKNWQDYDELLPWNFKKTH